MWRASCVRRSAGGGGGGAPKHAPALGKVAVSVVWPIDYKTAKEQARRDGRISLNELKRQELARVAHDPAYIALSDRGKQLAAELKLPMLAATRREDGIEYELQLTPQRLQLKPLHEHYTPNIYADFDAYWRRRASYTVDSPLVRSVTVANIPLARTPIVDATGGLARDAFIIASFGPRVVVVERHPIIYALLSDGVKRAKTDEAKAVLERMVFIHGDSLQLLPRMDPAPEVIYLDPMFTWPKGTMPTALPRKEMLISRRLVGTDPDSNALLGTALACARQRVVLKQPLVSERPAGAVGEVQSANYRFAIFSAAQAREHSEARRKQAQLIRREQDAKTALASFLAASTSVTASSPPSSLSLVASAPITPSSSPQKDVALSAAQKVAAKKVGRAAEEEPIIPAAEYSIATQETAANNFVSHSSPPPASTSTPLAKPEPATDSAPLSSAGTTENAPKKRGRGRRKGSGSRNKAPT